MKVTVLVDFANDSVGTALDVARALGDDLWGVRLDTSEQLTDPHGEGPGVTPQLVRAVRAALDEEGFDGVHIAVSGGFTVEKITAFEEAGVPVDAYGVGSSLLRGTNDFTADVVCVEGAPGAKAGRELRPSERLAMVV